MKRKGIDSVAMSRNFRHGDKTERPDLSGYGYHLSDNDCHIHGKPDGGYVTPEEHKEEEFFAAAAALLDATPLSEPSAG
jgi:hypothetical protein